MTLAQAARNGERAASSARTASSSGKRARVPDSEEDDDYPNSDDDDDVIPRRYTSRSGIRLTTEFFEFRSNQKRPKRRIVHQWLFFRQMKPALPCGLRIAGAR